MKRSRATQLDDTQHGSKRSSTEQSKISTKASKQITPLKNENKMIYIGIDVHKVFLQIAGVNENGDLLFNRRVNSDHASVMNFFAQFPRDKTRCVMESSSVWYGLYRYMTDSLKLNVVVSNPYQTKAIAASKKKTDKVDARILADLLRTGYIALCHIPDIGTISARQLVRYRAYLVRQRTRHRNKIHGILLQSGIKIPGTPFSKGHIQQLRKLGDYRIDGHLRIMETYDKELYFRNLEIKKRVQESNPAKLLKTIPGIGDYSALALISEIGDISRFPTAQQLCSYAGLVSSVRNSADKVMLGPITKRGSRIMRWILVEAVHSHTRYAADSPITIFYKRLQERRGTSKAAVAAANKLLRFIFHMLKKDIDFTTNCNQNH